MKEFIIFVLTVKDFLTELRETIKKMKQKLIKHTLR